MGIPTIVGISGLMTAIEDGQVVTMDGQAGTVQVKR
jgi:phosphohistidine swiveling domain-containing protein